MDKWSSNKTSRPPSRSFRRLSVRSDGTASPSAWLARRKQSAFAASKRLQAAIKAKKAAVKVVEVN